MPLRRPRGGSRGRPRADKSGWYLPLALAVDALGAALPVYFLLDGLRPAYAVGLALGVGAVWVSVHAVHRRYGERWLGETRGLLATVHDWLALLGLLAVLQVPLGGIGSPGGLLLAVTPALLLTAACRALTHRHLTAQRRQAQAVRRVLVVGEAPAVDRVVEQLAGRTDQPYVVIGAVSVGTGVPRSGVQVAGRAGDAKGAGSVARAAAWRSGAEAVLLVPGTLVSDAELRQLMWTVQDAGLRLLVASGLCDVAPHRIRGTTAAGLHLLHVDPPLRRGPQLAAKSALDRAGAALGLLALAPLLALIAAVVRLGSSGPALYRQTRIGHRGLPFTMWKFRSMHEGAERHRAQLAESNEQDGPLFKMRADPRVTRVGRVLRRTSLDELPQLVNVLRGEMSLVGPRPPLPDEVAGYRDTELRRLQVKPGMTGPWQVGGRSELSWDETLALDLRYADNWSLTTDLDLLARTVRAVLDGRGAY
ncbi:exopolysaccharide biosynthesis polyprenyl glycosylphosphotransferase [Streptomyces sp. SB3404]|uniref:Exopolysaccharide biosynthesis polyprenyl glycosylphosphotransferase n=1 Tax=Streptomyces boncukensis TaxID=2711219 RepID=A0A6G4X3L4_9ACTN|nr:exopolysaccharide biosynthesis polyprenyl glycosylphosphotransferase [Streptomyces boncukensis]